jgi:hypothetical protein
MANTIEVHKELDLIQAIINRMAANSFEVKKWLIGILTAITVFKYDKLLGTDSYHIWILLVPILSFWFLNAFFLSNEKRYRELYQWVVKHRPNTDKYLYDLNTMQRECPDGQVVDLNKKANSIGAVFFSETLLPFYIIPVLFIVFYSLYQFCSL